MFSVTILNVKILVFTAACHKSCVALGTTNMSNNACVSICIGLEVSYYEHLSFNAHKQLCIVTIVDSMSIDSADGLVIAS